MHSYNILLFLDYKEELEGRTQFTSYHKRMLHEDFFMHPKRRKKEKKKRGRDADTYNDRGNWQIHDEWEQESHKNKDMKTKHKKKHHEEHKKKKKDKHVKNH